MYRVAGYRIGADGNKPTLIDRSSIELAPNSAKNTRNYEVETGPFDCLVQGLAAGGQGVAHRNNRNPKPGCQDHGHVAYGCFLPIFLHNSPVLRVGGSLNGLLVL